MMEHEMCCGTTCDKQQVAAEFERIAERNRSLEALLKLAIKERDNLQIMVDANLRVNGRLRTMAIKNGYSPAGEMNEQEYLLNRFDEIKQERDEALAYAERFKSVVEAVANIGVDFGYGAYEIQADIIDFARVILSEQPPAALAALKAELRGEAVILTKESVYKAFVKFCESNRQYDLDPRLHSHSGGINAGGYIRDGDTAKMFAAFKGGVVLASNQRAQEAK